MTQETIHEEGPLPTAGQTLYQRSERPAAGAIARLAIVHGYGDHGGRFAHFMKWMAQRRVACHAIDLRGQGLAAGRRGFVGKWEEYLDDLRQFLLSLPNSPGVPLFLLGHSHGALVISAAVIRNIEGVATARGCMLVSPYFKSRVVIPKWKVLAARMLRPVVPWLAFRTGLRSEWMSADPAMVEDSRADKLCVRIATPGWYVGHLAAQREVLANAGQFTQPLLLLAGSADRIADADTAKKFVDAAGSKDKSFRLYNGLRHELLREANREAIFGDVLNWIIARA